MPNTLKIVINTAPLISLVAATSDLKILQSLYDQVLVPLEVCQEILTGGTLNRSGLSCTFLAAVLKISPAYQQASVLATNADFTKDTIVVDATHYRNVRSLILAFENNNFATWAFFFTSIRNCLIRF